MDWLREGVEASRVPFRLEADRLDEYVGRYGPRIIAQDGDDLRYSREGAGSDVVLVPLGPDLFQLEGNPTFRIRFERSPEGRIQAIVGLYSDGRTDRTERTSG